MQNSPVPSSDLPTSQPVPPPPGPLPMRISGPTSFPPPHPQTGNQTGNQTGLQTGTLQHPGNAYQPAAKQHPSVTVQMSPRNLIIGGSVLAFVLLVVAAFAIFHMLGSSDTSRDPYMNAGSFPGSTTTTDSNGNSVTMGPGARSVQNADGSTTTTDANGNTVTQGGSDTGTGQGAGQSAGQGARQGFPGQQQNPYMNNNSFPQQGAPQQQDGFPQQQQGYPQQQQQQPNGFNPQQGYPQQQQGGYPQQ